MENKYKRLLKNTIWTLTGNSGSKLLGFLLLPLYTKWLGTYGFGLSDLITTYSSFLISIMTMSVSEAIFVFTKNTNDRDKSAFYSSSLIFVSFILFIWCILFYIIKNIATNYNINNSFIDNIWFIYGIVLTSFLQQFVQQFVISLEKIKVYSFTGIILTISTFLFSFILIPKLGVKGYIASIIIANIITILYCFIFSRSYKYINIKLFDYNKVRSILKYSLPLIPNSIIWWLVSALNRPIMEHYLDFSTIGIYAIANRFPAIINMLFTIFSISWNISVFEEYNKKGYVDFYKNVFNSLFFVITFASVILISLSEYIINIFTTDEFHCAYLYMPFLIIAAFLSCISSFLGTNFSVVKESKYFFYSSIWGATTAILFNFLLIPALELWGTVISTLLSFATMTIARYYYSMKYVKAKLANKIILYLIILLVVSLSTIMLDKSALRIIIYIIAIGILCKSEINTFKGLTQVIKNKLWHDF